MGGGPAPRPDAPAGAALGRVFGTFCAALHASSGLACAAAALAVPEPPVSVPLLLVVVPVLTCWSLVFAGLAVRRGLRPVPVAVDVGLTVVTCLLIGRLVAAEVLPGEVSWIAIMASTTVIVAQLGLPARLSIPAGLLVTVAYAVGAHLAGDDAEATAHAATLAVQTFSAAGLGWLARRGSRSADAAFAGHQQAVRQAVLARAARAAERQQNRDLHDTVLSTLTMVGLGGAGADGRLRDRAAADLRTLAGLAGARGGADAEPVTERLDERLREVLASTGGHACGAELAPVTVPGPVAAAIAAGVAEALANVDRHAPQASVRITLRVTGGTVAVEVVDDGPGFDPGAVPAHRYGLRESIRGRLAAVGGRAVVDSAPGRGTRIRLEWPAAGVER
ncbi:sensor histidine kinase [Plantactinospora sp. KBS50]|uniref:sensor histidine kinase n=1 Tax=Plantactinospora sp. KBS50 TaxID=2024580 RepID=UPI000BAAC312|nr:ATP-binding protein [Plantactinospora sp. KBS50]